MAAISGKTQNLNGQLYSHTPVVVYVVLIVESNYDIMNIHRGDF